ncbi:MAG: capsular biosynthesis protein, partial [Bacteroidales bacterium]|nr:capsular biosynthesis protein [Bacteroidales bacterium]
PDYFFFQILFDVLPSFGDYPLVSDCLPHYLQQSINDPSFPLMDKDEILKKIHIHKLTYK